MMISSPARVQRKRCLSLINSRAFAPWLVELPMILETSTWGLLGNIVLVKNEMEDNQATQEYLQDVLMSINRATRLAQQ